MAKFYRGLRASYNATIHADGIYFATDTAEILMNGVSYTGAVSGKDLVVEKIALKEDGSAIVITYTDTTTSEISVSTASSNYTSNIEDKTLTTPSAVGGIAAGTVLSSLEGKSYDSIFDDLLFPTVNPTFTNPSASIKLNGYAATQEVGATAPTTSDFTVSFNAGAITLNGVKQNNRAGAQDTANSYIYYGGSTSNKTLPSKVTLGNVSYNYHAAYAEGPQPYDNKGNAYSTPLAAGSVNSSAVNVNGTYPWYASTAEATSSNPVVKQALIAWNTTAGSMTTPRFTVQPSGTLPQVFKLPRKLSSLQMLNTVSNQMETIGTTAYTETTETISVNGNSVTYYVYTYNGSDRGSVTLLAKF